MEKSCAAPWPMLDASFSDWRAGKLGSGELTERIHQFHNGRARKLWKKYNGGLSGMVVASAIVDGVLDRAAVSRDLLAYLESGIQFCEENRRRPPGPVGNKGASS